MTKAGSKSRTLMGSTASESRIESGSTSPESRTTDDEDGSRETPPYRAPMGARKYTGLTTMTKEWEREFAVSRMQEDPTISYRALAKVLGTSDATIRQWRDEEGIHPRPHHNTGRRRDGTRSVPWPGKPARPIEPELQDDEERQDGEEPEEEDNDEAFELDDTPAGSHAANLAQTWETIGRLGACGLVRRPQHRVGHAAAHRQGPRLLRDDQLRQIRGRNSRRSRPPSMLESLADPPPSSCSSRRRPI